MSPATTTSRLPWIGLLLLLLPGAALAAEPKQYAHFFLQGKISAADGGAAAGARVRLVGADATSFEATTDARGVFLFERLPVQRYRLSVTTAGGRAIRSFEEVDLGDPARRRLTIRMGEGPGQSAELYAPGPEQLDVTFTARAPRWKRFWIGFGVFLGTAGALALL
jgi:hypothetical protein